MQISYDAEVFTVSADRRSGRREVKKTRGGDVFIAESGWGGEIARRMDHLACFVGGMLELGCALASLCRRLSH